MGISFSLCFEIIIHTIYNLNLAIPSVIKLTPGHRLPSDTTQFGGTYIFQENTVNSDRQSWVWKHRWNSFAIWWDNVSNNWVIGNLADKGTSKARIKGPLNNNKLPNQITSGWCYWDNSIDFDGFWEPKQQGDS